ncbi:hypothetical protein AKJ16_DCAP00434 [Drosera capensis]
MNWITTKLQTSTKSKSKKPHRGGGGGVGVFCKLLRRIRSPASLRRRYSDLRRRSGMMLGVVRRKVVGEAASATVSGCSLRRVKSSAPAVSRGYAVMGETALLGTASRLVRNFSSHGFVGLLYHVVAWILLSRLHIGAIHERLVGSRSQVQCLFVTGEVVEAVVPFMRESIIDGTLATFSKQPGDHVEVDEPIAQIETDKATIDVGSHEAGVIKEFLAKEGDIVEPGFKIVMTSQPSMAERHEQWMAKYGRVYKDVAEKEMRFNMFKKTVEYIEAMNKLNRGYTVGLNPFSDMYTEEVIATHCGYRRELEPN